MNALDSARDAKQADLLAVLRATIRVPIDIAGCDFAERDTLGDCHAQDWP